jgi:diguanylate cyclase (GGDEF)-like protein
MLPGTDVQGARTVAERIREAVAETVILMSDESILPSVTVSLGVAQCLDQASATALLETADHALYRAKKAGRNRVSE